ncbi:MAG: hypothetical protein VB108_05345 [Anaerolineaceae bacterium]|nr:hypothetical protein [Anaerolineaceae bacterium]
MMNNSPVTRIKKTYFYGAVGVIAGFVLGLLVGWVVWPVSWTDASSANLRADMQQNVMSNAVLAYTLTNDQDKALQVYKDFGEKAPTVLAQLKANPGLLNQEQIARFATAVSAPAVAENPAKPAGTDPASASPAALSKKNTGVLGMVLLGLLVAGAAAVYWFFFRNREPASNTIMSMVTKSTQNGPLSKIKQAGMPAKPASSSQNTVAQRRMDIPSVMNQAGQAFSPVAEPSPRPIPAAEEKPALIPSGKPIAQFLTTYMYGDDLYDESFIFDSPNGAFLGECGVSFSDIIGTGEPKKVSAFEIWLFDKNDVQTVTNVLMCQHAFEDIFMRENLEKKGDSVLAELEKRFTMETASLILEGHIVDLNYGELVQTPQSYFQRLTLELAVYEKK